jgi:hypothetical protein
MATNIASWFTKLFKKEKPTIEFYNFQSFHPEESWPIIPTSEVKMPWLQAQKDKYIKRKEASANKKPDWVTSTHMCSGIVELMRTGYVLRAYTDIYIETKGDGVTFTHDVSEFIKQTGAPAVSHFPPSLFTDDVKTPPNTLKTIIKINCPWRVKMPAGWGLLMLPLQYVNEERFTAASGFINPEDSNEINCILYWHKLAGSTIITAGTPLCMMVPVPLEVNKKFELINRQGTQEESKVERITSFALHNGFEKNRQLINKIRKKFLPTITGSK